MNTRELIEKWRARRDLCARLSVTGPFPAEHASEEAAIDNFIDDLEAFAASHADSPPHAGSPELTKVGGRRAIVMRDKPARFYITDAEKAGEIVLTRGGK